MFRAVFIAGLRDIALLGRVFQRTSMDRSTQASLATDSDPDTASATDMSEGQWWVVDLPDVYIVQRINIQTGPGEWHLT